MTTDRTHPEDGQSSVAEHCPQYEALVEHARDGGLDVQREGRIERVSTDSAR